MLALLVACTVRAQVSKNPGRAEIDRGRILLVLPFENHTGHLSLEWIREAAADILSSRLTSAGFSPLSRSDRLYALDHLGLPQGFQPSHASALKLAQTLDADSIIFGIYKLNGSKIVTEARLVNVPRLHMSAPVTAQGDLRDMIAVFSSLSWKLARELDPRFDVSEKTFVAAGKGVRVDAFEQYIRGITETDQQERLRHLKKAVQLSPSYEPAWMALGRTYYEEERYGEAAAAFARVGRHNSDALKAGFYRGLALIFSGDYPQAEEAFQGVARILPLPQVLNNEGIALARQGKDGIPFFRRAIAADPNTANYHFNLAVSLKREGKSDKALAELAHCLKLNPGDREARELQTEWREPPGAKNDEDASDTDPLERISRRFDEAAFRQAAEMMDQMEASRIAALKPRQKAQKLSEEAKNYLNHGLLLEAERIYLAAIAADDKVAEAHADLAEVREQTGDVVSARKQALTALKLMPSADAYLVMGRLDFAAGNLDQASYETSEAIKLDPANKAAQQLQRQIEAKEGRKK